MKIAYLVNTYPRPSQTFIRREIHALERMGWQIERFALRSDRAALVDPADIAEDSRTEHLLDKGLSRLLPTAFGWLARNPVGALRSLRLAIKCGQRGAGGTPGTGGILRHLVYFLEAAQFARRCNELRLSHAHVHFGTNGATVAMLASEMGGPGYSFTTHGPEEFDAPRAHSLGEKADRARFTVAISSFGRSQLCRWSLPETWPRINVVHCGIEPWKYTNIPPLPDGGPRLVAIGRLSEQKGFGLLLDALEIVAPDIPDLRLTLVGDGELRPQIEARIAELGLSRHVHLAGWLDENRVNQALAASTALVLPSFAEGLPMVVMEAMASGRPVIATSIAGIPELVTPECGWLVPAGDPKALAKAIKDLAETPRDRLSIMGQTAHHRVLMRHNIDTEAEKLAILIARKGVPE
ncbi:glycosyltransferase [Thioclava sp. FR2]|uniref:glycosyltransferase n=1 Tax=Thioclava sp. FR2 TaxID=3445780 RepID=UPI003EBC25DC